MGRSSDDPAGTAVQASNADSAVCTIRVVVNGQQHRFPPGTTIANLLEQVGLASATCAVEVNRTIAPRAEHGRIILAEHDEIEIVTLVGGG
ncbi:MAG: sulfur carrier protein ThiS [Planctomycetota bacterium]